MTKIQIVDHPTTQANRAIRNHWGSTKTQRTMSMTFTGWEMLSSLAEGAEMNRSEVLEVLIRSATQVGIDLREERNVLMNVGGSRQSSDTFGVVKDALVEMDELTN